MTPLEERNQLVLSKISISETSEIWTSLFVERDRASVDIRMFYAHGSTFLPTRKGVRIRSADLPALRQAIDDALAYIKLEGLDGDGQR
jgi:hypothetical protein